MRRSLILVVALALLLPASQGQAGPAVGPRSPVLGTVPRYADPAHDVGPADPAEPLNVVLALSSRDPSGLMQAAGLAVGNDAVLTRSELVQRYGPTSAAASAVDSWLDSEGLTARPTGNEFLLSVSTTVGQAEHTFGVPIERYQVGALSLRAPAADPLVPATIAPLLQGIVGLSDAPITTYHAASPSPFSTQTPGAPPFTPSDLRNAYDTQSILDAGHTGAGTTAAIVSWGPSDQSSLDEYSTQFGLPRASLTTHAEGGGSTCAGSEDLEWDLDVQMEHALSPEAKLDVYCAATNSFADLLTTVGLVVSADTADAIDQSWGTCEAYVSASTASAYETQYASAAAQGQAFFTSSGDEGSRECTRADPNNQAISPAFPSTAPHVTSVAGTSLVMSGATYSSERAWDTCAPCPGGGYEATGGGMSSLFPKPAWQTLPLNAAGRGTGDVSAVADPATGVQVRSGGAWWEVGGTSVSSPLWAGYWSDVVQATGRKGNAAPLVWPLVPLSTYALTLHDVTSGSNGDYRAGPSYDYPTGLGSMRGSPLFKYLEGLPTEPLNVAATPGPGKGEITLSWSPPAIGNNGSITGYHVYGGNASGGESLLSTTGNVTTFKEAGLPNGQTRYYEVAAVTANGEGILSLEASARTFIPPSHPQGLVAVTNATKTTGEVSVNLGEAVLRWSSPLDDGGTNRTTYNVYRGASSGQETFLATAGEALTFTDHAPPIGISYYVVKAANVAGESGPSNEVRNVAT